MEIGNLSGGSGGGDAETCEGAVSLRMALGATPRDVLRMVLNDGLIVALAGIALSTASALLLSSVLAGVLDGITPPNPTSFVLGSVELFGLTGVASYIPARRAARIEPVRALRSE